MMDGVSTPRALNIGRHWSRMLAMTFIRLYLLLMSSTFNSLQGDESRTVQVKPQIKNIHITDQFQLQRMAMNYKTVHAYSRR